MPSFDPGSLAPDARPYMAHAPLAGATADPVLTSGLGKGLGREAYRANRRPKSGLIDIVREAA
ncbi:MAG: hypothetical protein K0R88_2910 [Solirubrobacterales bacterium]|nr:hypothetical protein [Solirubrobacterales bacterium]